MGHIADAQGSFYHTATGLQLEVWKVSIKKINILPTTMS